MPEAHWPEVLRVFYEDELVIKDLPLSDTGMSPDMENNEDLRHLAERTSLDPSKVWTELTFLWEVELIDRVQRRSDDVIGLTNEGFNVAHEREQRNQHQELIRTQSDATGVLANFTIILGATAMIQALASVVSAPQYSVMLSVIYAALLLALLWKRDELFYQTENSESYSNILD